MSRSRAIAALVLAATVAITGACAAQPGATLLDKKFQRAAATFHKYDVHGQTVYCKKGVPATFSRLPGWQCYTEPQLRQVVESFERNRSRNMLSYNHNITKGG